MPIHRRLRIVGRRGDLDGGGNMFEWRWLVMVLPGVLGACAFLAIVVHDLDARQRLAKLRERLEARRHAAEQTAAASRVDGPSGPS